MDSSNAAAFGAAARTRQALRTRSNWIQLAQFCTVGALGYVVNLIVYTLLLKQAGLHYLAAATCSFLVAVSSNYLWNRIWTFRGQRGHVGQQGLRFFVVALVSLAGNLLVLRGLVGIGLAAVPAQAVAIVIVTPLNFVGNKLWSFRR